MSAPELPPEYVVLPRATRDFMLAALREASEALRESHGLRATSHILLREGVQLTGENSFRLNHENPLLLLNISQRLLSDTDPAAAPLPGGSRR